MDTDPNHQNYPGYFFRDLSKNSRIVLVIGGTKAIKEARTKTKLTELLNNLKDKNQVRIIETEKVDECEQRLERRIIEVVGDIPKECDDLHIFALANVSNCLLVISRDNRMAVCRNNIRNKIGHQNCPNISVIQNETAYNSTKR